MAIQSKENPLNYTGLSYEDIKKQIDTSLKSDSRFDNFVDSALYKSMMNLFAGSTDLTNYYVERTAEEMYLETAQHLSSVIANANNLGYIVRRPLGAQANITFKISGPLVSAAAGQEIIVTGYSDLNFNGTQFKLLNSYKYVLTTDDANILQTANGSISFNEAEIVDNDSNESVPISILQGEERTFEIAPGNSTGQKWQKYNIDDPSFSNYFGESDFGDWNNSTETSSTNLTQVEITDGGDSRLYYINKRSLTAEVNTYNLIQESTSAAPDICLIKTNKDTTVDIFFGDGVSSSIGAKTGETIKVKYFSVLGTDANQIGVLNKKIDFNGAITLDSNPITSNTETFFKSNIRSGANLEDKESIRLNAPAIFQSLDRLVTKVDYATYLKTITDPIFVKLSVAWGEADEIAKQRSLGYQVTAIKELFNVIISSVLSSVYKFDIYMKPKKLLVGTSEYYDADDIETTFLDSVPTSGFAAKTYFDFYIKNDIASYMNYLYDENNSNNAKIKTFLSKLVERSQATVKNVYITPIVQGFELVGDVVLKNFSDIETEKIKILNAVYTMLDSGMNFETQVYISNISDIINSIPSVKHSSISFKAIDVDDENKLSTIENNVATSGYYSSTVYNDITNVAASTLYEYLTKSTSEMSDVDVRTANGLVSAEQIDSQYLDLNKNDTIKINNLDTIFSGTNLGSNVSIMFNEFRTATSQKRRITQFTERGFYEDFAKIFYDATATYTQLDGLTYYRDSEDFRLFISKVKATMQQTLRESMKDEYGNIVNYSFPNELPVIYDKLTFKY